MGKKILYAASSFDHLKTFHLPYIDALMEQGCEVHAMGAGDSKGLPQKVTAIEMPFEKRMSSFKNLICALKIALQVRREDYDIVSVHTSLAAFFVRLGVMLSGKSPGSSIPFTVTCLMTRPRGASGWSFCWPKR